MSAKTKVTTARYSPRTRSEPMPMPSASTAEATVVTAMATQNGTPSVVSRAAKSAASPAKAIWPSESWPSQPVSTVSDEAQMANASTAV